MNIPEIEELKSLVEKKYSRRLSTTTDFEEFSVVLKKSRQETVSPSTLKRMWGYVHDTHKTRKFTLDILARYVGYDNFDMYVAWLKTNTRYNSSFFNERQLTCAGLETGQMLEIGWSPNRLLTLRYLGDSMFEVTKSRNSKLIAGDRFITGCFIMCQPLLLPYVLRGEEKTKSFIAGRNGGLNVIRVLSYG